MQAIIIGAGRGVRLMPTTADAPKCFATVGGRRILDWILDAFRSNDVRTICFIGGYRIEAVQREYPDLLFRHNAHWKDNNILASLFHAEDRMDEPFICCYADILFSPAVVTALLASDHDISLAVDTEWLVRYEHRSDHPTTDAEKVTAHNGAVTRVHRGIDEADAHGEYIGVAKFSAQGARELRQHYHRCRDLYAGGPFRESTTYEKAFLIELLQEMIEHGSRMVHVDTPGQYVEVDTQQDYDYARRYWQSRHLNR